jgi:DNA-binding Xre family transcriptional regulator
MDISKAFNQTLERFCISGKWLAAQSGVSEVMISRLRNGKQVQTDTLGRLLDGLPNEPRQYFCSLLSGENLTNHIDIQYLIENATDEEIAKMMVLIAHKWRRVRQNTQIVA